MAIETWSSWSALVGVESVEHGFARCLFSDINAAEVISATINPELTPASGAKKGGKPKFSLGSTNNAIRR